LGELLFFACAKVFNNRRLVKVTKRKHPLPSRPARVAVGVRCASGIFLRDIVSRRKTPHIHVRRPAGIFPLAPPLRKGTRKAEKQQQQQQ